MSPLSFFRKYQKTMLAVAAVGAMFAFGILPIVSDWQNQAGGGGGGGYDADAVAVSWDGGSIREGELQNLRAVRSAVNQFQQSVIQTAVQRGGQPRSTIVPNTASEASVVESMLLAKEAEKLGISVGDEAVLRHLTENLADDVIDRNELALMLKQNTRMTQAQLFDAVRMEMAAQQLRVVANGSAFDGALTDTAVSPGQAFEYFKRLYRRMEAEIVEIPVEDFVAKVSEEPTSADVQELYDEYKEVFPSAFAPTPGFKEPARASFQWVKADFPSFLEREIAKVTDAEIAASYEENKESYRKVSLPSTDDLGLPDTDSAETEALDDVPTTEAATDSQLELNSSANEETEEPANEETSAAEQATDETITAESADAETASDDAGSEPASDDISAESNVEEASDDVEKAGDDTDEAPLKADDIPTSVEDAADTDANAEGETTADAGVIDTSSVDGDVTETVAEYQPLEEVRDDIARQIARPRASDAMKAALDKVNAAMSDYFDDYMYWDTTPDDEQGAKPSTPNLEQIAKDNGLIYGAIPLISALEAEQYELGRAFDLDFSTGQIRRVPFTMMGFSPSLPLFKARSIAASDVDSRFMFWKVDQKEAYTPSLEEVRPKVVKHWKMKKAIDLAKKAAQDDYVAKLGSDQSLKTASDAGAFGDEKAAVTDSGQFTWMNFGATPSGQGPPRISAVEGVKFPGEQFMQDVSNLNSGESIVTTNYPESHVYVVYMKGVTGNDEDLQKLFLNEGVKTPVLYMARQDSMRTAAEWYMDKEKEFGVEWARPAQ